MKFLSVSEGKKERRFTGTASDGPFCGTAPLLFDEQLHEHGGEVLRYGGAVGAGLVPELRDGEKTHRDVEGVKGLGRAAVLIGAGDAGKGARGLAGVAEIGVFPFLGPGRLVQVDYPLAGGDVRAAQAQIFCQHGLVKGHRPRPVGQGVEDLDGNAVHVIVKADEPAAVLVEAHGAAGVGHILAHVGSGRGVRLEVVPEKAPAYLDGKARKARQRLVHRRLEADGVHPLGHDGGKAVYGRKLVPLDRGIHEAGVVHPVPGSAGSVHSRLRRRYNGILPPPVKAHKSKFKIC
ncbi:MAG: hypothetical protein ACLTSG_14005 [Lachnospiraceae bacterium]